MLFLLFLTASSKIAKSTRPLMKDKSKEGFKMMGFMLLTLSFTVAILLAGVISTVVLFKLMGNEKFVEWLMNYYMKQIEQSAKVFDNLEEAGV